MKGQCNALTRIGVHTWVWVCWLSVCFTATLSLSDSCDSSNRNNKHTETHWPSWPLSSCLCCISPTKQGLRTVCTVFYLQQPPTPLPLLLTSPVSCQGNPSFLFSFRFLHLKASIFSPLSPSSLFLSSLPLSPSLSFAVYPSSSSVSLIFHPPPPPFLSSPLLSLSSSSVCSHCLYLFSLHLSPLITHSIGLWLACYV